MQASRPALGSRLQRHDAVNFRSARLHGPRARKTAIHAQAQKVPVRFTVRREVQYGQQLRVVGNHPSLGNWNTGNALALSWHEGHIWSGEVQLGVGDTVEFKIVCTSDGPAEWEGGPNRTFEVAGADHSLDVHCSWGKTSSRDVRSRELGDGQPHFDDLAAAVAQTVGAGSGDKSARVTSTSTMSDSEGSSSGSPSGMSTQDETSAGARWQGREVVFMRSNDHSRERKGQWDTSGLSPGPVLDLVVGDQGAANWLAKLGVARQLLVDSAPRMRPDAESLASALVYLSWVNTGAIPCVEGGGHHRPNHHARTAQQIFRSLEWVIEEDRPRGPAGTVQQPRLRSLLARRLHSRLPSFNASFTQSVPLTRIRDIAHRGDIPHELKQEIKHTLQNKLHRNAGPEDLVATEAMLERITARPGEYSAAFVDEFKIFAAELRDFFNAGGLTATLEGLRGVLEADPVDGQTLDAFLAAKARLDSMTAPPLAEIMGVAHAATTLRALLLRALSSGLRNDAPDAALAMRQRFRLAELRCEEYLFVLMSRFINALEEQGGASALAAARSSVAWSHPLAVLLLGVRNLGLGGWNPAECMALENEVTAWQQDAEYDNRDNALRLKATLERCLRLTEGYTDTLLAALPPRAEELGRALGVADWAVRAFTEGEVRASLVFQLSKLGALLLMAARSLAGVTPWDTLVAGTAVGRLVEVDRLDPAALAGETRPVVLLLRGADGDEEVAAAGPFVGGIVLTQELPHLSHLGVRARQERVPFVTLEDRGVIAAEVEPLLGETVALVATPEGAQLRRATSSEEATVAAAHSRSDPAAAGPAPAVGSPLRIEKAKKPGIVPLVDCVPSIAGAKAAACAQLEQIAVKSSRLGDSFLTPPGCCVPFGTMELAIAGLPAGDQARYQELLAKVERAPVEDLDSLCDQLQDFIRALTVPDAVVRALCGTFPPGTPLIARSSANVEDLAGMSGAGLYDSIPNVPSDRPADIAAAIAEVWASLHTRRAVLSRRAAGVPQSDACMAVLVQAMLAPQYSFVLHTAAPLGDDPGTAVAEVAVGLGETLASGRRGTPWRLAVDKEGGDVTTLAFANFGLALVPAAAQGVASNGSGSSGTIHACSERLVDYSQQMLSRNAEARRRLAVRLGGLAALLEEEFGAPQDVEGCLLGDAVFVVQSRPQPM